MVDGPTFEEKPLKKAVLFMEPKLKAARQVSQQTLELKAPLAKRLMMTRQVYAIEEAADDPP